MTCAADNGRSYSRHWFTMPSVPGIKLDHCVRCNAPNPRGGSPIPDLGTLTKRCSRCSRDFSLTEFSYRPDRMTTSRRPWCRECSLSWWRDHRLLSKYGVTREQYNQLMENQGSSCAICKSPDGNRNGQPLMVDHDHTTEAVRGLLCFACNTGLGSFKDSPELLAAAMEYLTNS